MTSMGNAVIILYTSPIFTMLFAVWILGEKMNIIRYLSLSLAFLGLICIAWTKGISLHSTDIIGILAMLGSALLQGYITIGRKQILQDYDRISLIFYQSIIGMLAFLPFIYINQPYPSMPQIGVAVIYALLIGIGGFLLYFSALNKLHTIPVSVLSYSEMIGAIVLAVIVLGEQLTIISGLGAVLIVVAGMLIIFENKIYHHLFPVDRNTT